MKILIIMMKTNRMILQNVRNLTNTKLKEGCDTVASLFCTEFKINRP